MICKNCGNQIPDGATYCLFCGKQTSDNAETVNTPNVNSNNNNNNGNNEKQSGIKSVFAGLSAVLFLVTLIMIVISFLTDNDSLIRPTAGCFIFACVFAVLGKIL